MKKTFILLLNLILLIFTFSCTIGMYQHPRVVGKDKIQLGFGTFFSFTDMIGYSGGTTSYQKYISFVGYPDIFLRYGISEQVDIGIRYWNLVGILSDLKYQFFGDTNSELAMSLNVEFGSSYIPYPVIYETSPNITIAWGFGLLADYRINKDFSIYGGIKLRVTIIPAPTIVMMLPVEMDYETVNIGLPAVMFTSIGTLGISILESYNFNILAEVNLLKSVLSDKWAIAPGICFRLKL